MKKIMHILSLAVISYFNAFAQMTPDFVRFYASAAEMSWIAYKTKLIANGFRMKYREDTATWYKEVDGRYPAVHLFHIDYDACEMQLVFYYETQKDIEEAAKL